MITRQSACRTLYLLTRVSFLDADTAQKSTQRLVSFVESSAADALIQLIL